MSQRGRLEGSEVMNLTRWIAVGKLDRLMRPAKPEADLRISNLTRQVELASRVEVAGHGAKRRKGLLGRDRLPAGEGLWIVPCEAVHTFGMRFAIDLVYLDRRMRVKKVKSNVPPWRLSACLSAHSVIELASGTICSTQTKAGDMLEVSAASPLTDTRSGVDEPSPAVRNPDKTEGTEMSMRDKLRAVAEVLVVAICTLAFSLTCVGIFGSLLGHNAPGTRDFVEYWAAGRQLVHHANPYDGDALLRSERSVGFPSDLPPQIMANPPWALPLVLPLGLLSPMAAELLWLLLLLAGSRRFGADGLDHARPPRDSGKFSRIHVWAGSLLPAPGASIGSSAARSSSLSVPASIAPFPGRDLSVALYVETAPVSAFRHCSIGVGHHNENL